MSEKIKIELGSVQETLVLPLWGRSIESQKENPRLVDNKAVEIIAKIDYDFTTIARNISPLSQLAWVARSMYIDKAIRDYISRYPKAVIVNIGCGLDTTFDRVDNGQLTFIDLDLPDVIELRKQFFQDTDRRKMTASSFMDVNWFDQLKDEKNVLFFAAGVFYYFSENQIRDFFTALVPRFPGCEIVFDSASPTGVKVANKKVIQGGGMNESAILKWGIKTCRTIEEWDNRIELMNEQPMFKGFKKGYPPRLQFGLWMSDMLKIMSMAHLRIK